MKIKLIIIASLFSLGLKAQELAVSNVAKISMPKKVQKLDMAKMVENPQGLLKKRDVQYSSKNANLYEKDGVYIKIWETKEGYRKRTLKQVQSESADIYKLVKTSKIVSSDIKNYKGINYLILRTEEESEYYYRFYSEAHNDISINGFIKYKKEDQNKATSSLTEILNNTQFK